VEENGRVMISGTFKENVTGVLTAVRQAGSQT
jgi:hypothetical protein